jgi:aerobic carbon-monoxide dehydrogenase medium subunit
MFPGSFTYSRPASVADAVAALQANPEAKIIAGGHSLIPAMKLRLAMPGELVDLRGIDELREVTVSDAAVTVGAMVTYNELRDHADVAGTMPILNEALRLIGDAQVRENGTLVGSLVHNDPAADLTAVALALGGSLHAVGPDGERDIAIDDCFIDLWTTAIQPDEVVTHVALDRHDGAHMAYRKYAHPASGYAVVGVAVVVELDNDTVSSARVAISGATNTAMRLESVERALVGETLDEAHVTEAIEGASEGLEINGDTFASADYRAHLITVLTRRALLDTQE